MRDYIQTADNTSIVWSIAGSDSGGGAGIQVDLHTFQDFGVHGCTAVTALTAQNSFEVTYIQEATSEMLRAQFEALKKDLPPKAIKIGMLGSIEIMQEVHKFLKENSSLTIILDPVMVSTSGSLLLKPNAKDYLVKNIIPYATVLTPNLKEVEALVGSFPKTEEEI